MPPETVMLTDPSDPPLQETESVDVTLTAGPAILTRVTVAVFVQALASVTVTV